MAIPNSAAFSTNATAGMQVGTASNTQLSFWTNNTEKGRFLSTGEFLVGKTTIAAAVREEGMNEIRIIKHALTHNEIDANLV
jgi:predicted nuclease with TOPRIM domain